LQVLKSRLEANAFELLYPRQYHVAKTLFGRRVDSMRVVSQCLQRRISQLLESDSSFHSQLDYMHITCRVKEHYSAWKKLLRSHEGSKIHSGGGVVNTTTTSSIIRPVVDASSVSRQFQVQDMVALRVIIKAAPLYEGEEQKQIWSREQSLCYHAHQLIRSIYPEIGPTRVKDYIGRPKPNGYQSLHHTSKISVDGQEIPFEVQVRSEQMHNMAEFGFAAHWGYKQQDRMIQATTASPLQDRLLLTGQAPSPITPGDNQDEPEQQRNNNRTVHHQPIIQKPSSTTYLQTLEMARRSLVASSVFCFLTGSSIPDLEHGQLLTFESGATVEQILFDLQHLDASDDTIEKSTLTVYKNGRVAGWGEMLKNGDVLLFVQKSKKKPSIHRKRSSGISRISRPMSE
jgi:(p)ppGpp synthase/HD superfamily hydrolase